jgi:transcription elongation factor Elf1
MITDQLGLPLEVERDECPHCGERAVTVEFSLRAPSLYCAVCGARQETEGGAMLAILRGYGAL